MTASWSVPPPQSKTRVNSQAPPPATSSVVDSCPIDDDHRRGVVDRAWPANGFGSTKARSRLERLEVEARDA